MKLIIEHAGEILLVSLLIMAFFLGAGDNSYKSKGTSTQTQVMDRIDETLVLDVIGD